MSASLGRTMDWIGDRMKMTMEEVSQEHVKCYTDATPVILSAAL